jgi:hypothetical protein
LLVLGLSRRKFLASTGGALTLSAAIPGSTVAPTATRSDRTFTTQTKISEHYAGIQLSEGLMPKGGLVWQVRRVFWNVNFDGLVGSNVQTYLYRLPASFTTKQALIHMGESLEGWLGCCGNSQLTGNGDMTFAEDDVIVRPGELLWIFLITPGPINGFTVAAGMSVLEIAGR